jgi:hypothetical protein
VQANNLVLRRLRQEDYQVKASLSYVVRLGQPGLQNKTLYQTNKQHCPGSNVGSWRKDEVEF